MADPVEVTPQSGFNATPVIEIRGQNNFYYPDRRLKKENAESLKNVNLTERGTARRRNGYAKYNTGQITEATVAKPLVGLYQATYANGTVRNIEVAGTQIFTNDGTTRTNITGTTTLTSDSANSRCRFAFMEDAAFGTNDSDETFKITNAGVATDMTASVKVPWISCRDIVAHKNLLVVMNTVEYNTATEENVRHPTRIRWPDVTQGSLGIDVTNFPTDSKMEVQEGGAPILGGGNIGRESEGFLGVVKSDGVHLIEFILDGGFIEAVPRRQLTGNFEPIAKNGILHNPQFGLWVIARDGAYVVKPDLSFELVTQGVQAEWNSLKKSQIQHAVSFVRQGDHQVRTLISTTGNSLYHDKVLVWDWESNDVWFDEPYDEMNYADSWIRSNTEYDMFGSGDGYVHQGNDPYQSQDNGNDISWNITMSPNDINLAGVDKTIHSVVTHFVAVTGVQSISFTAFLNEGRVASRTDVLSIGSDLKWNDGTAWNSSGVTWPGEKTSLARSFVNRVAQTVSPQWEGDDNFELKGYQVIFSRAE